MNELLLALIVVAVEVSRFNMSHNLVLPFFFSVVHHPLITESADAFISSSGNDLRLRLVVWDGITRGDHHLLDNNFGVLSFLAVAVTFDGHDTISESLQVALVFSFLKLVLIFRSLNLSRLNGDLSAHVAHAGDFDNGNRLEGLDPFSLDFVVIGLLLEVSKHDEIIGRVGGYACDDTGSLGHGDGGHGEGVDEVVFSEGSLKLLSNNLFSHDLSEARPFSLNLGELLVSESLSSSVAHDEEISVDHLI